jgi:hypothetical protein
MSLKNVIRNVFNIRQEREIPAAGPMPPIGSNIVRARLRIRLKYPVTAEQWEFFSSHGWRTADMRKDRRRYMSVPDKILVKLLDRNGAERENLHERLIQAEMKKTAARKKPTEPAKTVKPRKSATSEMRVESPA